MKPYLTKPSSFGSAVLLLLILRGTLNAVIPLMDKTEARYSEIARIMAETDNWVTPQIDYGAPFWAKPPLSTWSTALSFKAFGVSEFTARLPYLLLSIVLVFMIGKYSKKRQLSFFLPGFILLTLPEFLLHAGVVSTDMVLAFCVTLTMLSFWEAIQEKSAKYWKYLVFIGIGLGLLAKGPIIGILTIPPVLIWAVIHKKISIIVLKISFMSGAFIALGISMPWYFFAEMHTPGFIDYFIIGEHFKRFFDSSWAGDKYGFPKSQPIGMIWAFLLAFCLPWLPVFIFKILKERKYIFKNEWTSFLFLWFIWTPLFFTFSKSLIHPYIMPVMVPLALLITHWFASFKRKVLLIKMALIIPMLSIASLTLGISTGYFECNVPTDKYLIENNTRIDETIYYLNSKKYSSQFYSKGKIRNITVQGLEDAMDSENESFKIIIKNSHFDKISLYAQGKLQLLDKNQNKSIYKCF